MQIQPYLTFSGRCDEAIALYTEALGGQVQMVMRFRDSPQPVPADMLPPGNEDKVMHASMQIGDTLLMLDDGGLCRGGASGFSGFSLSYTAADEAAAQRVFAALSAGGWVTMPLGATFWSPCFGMLKDRFGVSWMVTVPAA